MLLSNNESLLFCEIKPKIGITIVDCIISGDIIVGGVGIVSYIIIVG